MESGIFIKRVKIELVVSLILGLVLLTSGIVVEILDINILDNNRTLVALSFIPLGLFIASLIRLSDVKKHPDKYIDQYDERLVSARNRADSISLKIIQYFLALAFLGYTFAKSDDVFESLGWWLLLITFLLAFLLPAVILGDVNKKFRPRNDK
jgi:hypothetical protein